MRGLTSEILHDRALFVYDTVSRRVRPIQMHGLIQGPYRTTFFASNSLLLVVRISPAQSSSIDKETPTTTTTKAYRRDGRMSGGQTGAGEGGCVPSSSARPSPSPRPEDRSYTRLRTESPRGKISVRIPRKIETV